MSENPKRALFVALHDTCLNN